MVRSGIVRVGPAMRLENAAADHEIPILGKSAANGRDCFRLQQRISVHDQDDVRVCLRESGVQRMRLAAVLESEPPKARRGQAR